MSKYTPGPWRTEEVEVPRDNGMRLPFTYIKANKGWANSGMAGERTIAEVGHWRDRPNGEDDARLLAAAPELYEALDYIVGWMEGAKGDRNLILDDAYKALAKAEGNET